MRGQCLPTRSDPKAEAPRSQVFAPRTTQTMVLYPGSTAAPCPADPFRLEAGGGTLAAWSICIRPGDSSLLCWLRTGAPGGGRNSPDKAARGGRATAATGPHLGSRAVSNSSKELARAVTRIPMLPARRRFLWAR